mmetsp:Transcript_17706/g.43327  ORF Transcript_17706/g.43327 Transcript_17706/m.43327 type:complete len:482 (-) Transcript_17706:138-1583(-)
MYSPVAAMRDMRMPDAGLERPLVEPGEGDEDSRMDYEEVLNSAKLTKLQILGVIVCGLGNATDAVEVLSLSYVLPELHDMPTADKGMLSGGVFLGMLVGAVVAGLLADTQGRRPVLLASMALNFVFTLTFSVSSGVLVMTVLRFLTGCGVGGAVPVVFSLASEIVPARRRGAAISVVAAFWMIGSIAVALMAWAVIPTLGWRPFIALCSIPAFANACLCLFLVGESPRFLLLVGRIREATAAALRLTGLEGLPRGELLKDLQGVAYGERDKRSSMEQVRELTTGKHGRETWLLCGVTAGMGFGWYGLIMWMPTLFKARHVNLCLDPTAPQECVYQSALIAASSNLPGNLFSILLMDKMSRKGLLICSSLLTAVAALLGYISRTPWELGAAFCLFNGVSVLTWNALDVVSTESFPTALRGTSMGMLSSVGRIAATGAQFVYAFPAFAPPSPNPILASTVAIALSCAAALFLPETVGSAMEDV